MKKISVEGVLEEAHFFCDVHPEKECFSELKTASWYGSEFDMTGVEIHLCDECLKELYRLLWNNYTVKPKDIEI